MKLAHKWSTTGSLIQQIEGVDHTNNQCHERSPAHAQVLFIKLRHVCAVRSVFWIRLQTLVQANLMATRKRDLGEQEKHVL